MFTVSPVSQQQMQGLQLGLVKSGAQVTANGNQYQIEGHGITATANFDETLGSLQVTIVKKPWYVPESAIQGQLEQVLGR